AGPMHGIHLKWSVQASKKRSIMEDSRSDNSGTNTTHFGFQTVAEAEKARKVAEVFHSVAAKYDVMNDLMSAGLHRAWKAFTIARADVRPGMKVLDIAGGTGDLARAFARRAGASGEVWLTDINESMLRVGRDRLADDGLLPPVAVCDAEQLPVPAGSASDSACAPRHTRTAPRPRCVGCSSPAASCWCWNFPRLRPRWRRCTTGIPSTSCPGWARAWPATPTATATSRNPSACTRA